MLTTVWTEPKSIFIHCPTEFTAADQACAEFNSDRANAGLLSHTDEYDLALSGGLTQDTDAVLRDGGFPVELWVVLHVGELRPLLKSWISLIAGHAEEDAPTIFFSLKNRVSTVGKV